MSRLLPSEPIKFQEKNISIDGNIYSIPVEGKRYPFYRVTIIALTDDENQVGLFDVYYNSKYVICDRSNIVDKNSSIGKVSVVYEIKKSKVSLEKVKELIINLSKPKVSAEYYKILLLYQKISNESKLYKFLTMDEIRKSVSTFNDIISFFDKLESAVMKPFEFIEFMKDMKKYVQVVKTNDEVDKAEQEIETNMLGNSVVNKSIPVVANLVENIEMFISGKVKLNGLLILGKTGTGKTFTVKKVLYDNGYIQGKNYGYIRIVPDRMWEFVYYIYQDRNKPIVVLDDIDPIIDKGEYRTLLLQLLESSPLRNIQLPPEVSEKFLSTSNSKFLHDKISQFLVKSKFIIILNRTLDEVPLNIRTRCLTVNYFVDDKTIYKIISSNLEHIYPEIPLEVKEEILFKTYRLMKSIKMNLTYRQFDLAVTYYRTFGDKWYQKFESSLKVKS